MPTSGGIAGFERPRHHFYATAGTTLHDAGVEFSVSVPFERLPQLKGMGPIGGKPTAYLCVNFACALPTTDVAKVAEMLAQDSKVPNRG